MSVTVAIPSIPPRGAELSAALASVCGQTYAPDGIAVAMDQHHEGAAVTRNRALAMVNTEWVAFLDDDDLLLPRHLEHCLDAADATGADVVYPWFKVAGGGQPLSRNVGHVFDPDALREANYIPVTTLVRTKLAKDVGGFPTSDSEDWAHGAPEDWGFLLRLLDAGARFHHTPHVTWVWRNPAGNTRGQAWKP